VNHREISLFPSERPSSHAGRWFFGGRAKILIPHQFVVFSSTVFLFLFLPIVLFVYYVLPRVVRNAWLLVVSLFFYAWGERGYTVVMLGSMTLNYLFGLAVDFTRGGRWAKATLGLTVAANLGLLISFKYANLLVSTLNATGLTHWKLDPVHLPIGISFFTFHAMSYVIDIYRGDARVQRDPLNLGLYIALFPQLIAGPILRYHDVADQLVARTVTLEKFAYGIRRFIIGLAKKVLIANTLASLADEIFKLPAEHLGAPVAWLGIVSYTLQIYFDFSGYSDMAIGLGAMFGFHFLENFNYPYISRSIQEFWRRWHISLSNWFRDYLYIPLGGNRCGPRRVYLNLLIVFFLCGLWHGPSWCFVAWGLFHGAFLALERTRWGGWIKRLPLPVQHIYALLIVLIGWVFFRVENFPDAFRYLQAMAGLNHPVEFAYNASFYLTPLVNFTLVVAMLAATPLGVRVKERLSHVLAQTPSARLEATLRLGRTVALLALLGLSAMQLAAGTYNPFIYFRF
jgi:alginate O-acetyltransferase complex protein AlgI